MLVPDAVRTLERDLQTHFGARLLSLVAHASADGDDRAPVGTLALVDGLTPDDLRALADRLPSWRDAGLDTPLVITRQEFARSLDAFPLEFGAILADHVVVSGENPFDGLRVDPGHMRHACEIQARSHLLHLREGYIETEGRVDRVADLIMESAAPLAALVRSVRRLNGDRAGDPVAAAQVVGRGLGLGSDVLVEVVSLVKRETMSGDDARRLFPLYLDALERLTRSIDRWPSA